MSGQRHAPPYFTPRKDPVPIVQKAGWAPGSVWTDGKSRPTGIQSPDRPARSQSPYLLSYLAHTKCEYISRIRTHTRRENFRGIWSCRFRATLATGVIKLSSLTCPLTEHTESLNLFTLGLWTRQIIQRFCWMWELGLHFAYTECPGRNVPDFGRVFLMLKYTDITQNTYVQSWTVTEIMAREVWNFDSCYTLIDYQIHIKTGRNMWFL